MNRQQRWTMSAVVLGSAIVFLDSTLVSVALPRIGEELPSKTFGVLEGQSFVYNGYLLALSALLILAGALNDYYGRRRMFALGLAGFGLTSLLCGLAPTMDSLIIFRIFQGAAGAILVPGSLSIITSSFHGEDQGRAFGIWAGGSAAATILGPFVGGIFVDTISWRSAFFINIPLLVVAYHATQRHVTESRDETASGSFDWLGAVVVAIAVGGMSFGAIRGQEREWQDTAAFVALAAGVIAAVAFPILMARSENPLVPLELFRSRNFSVTNISTLLIYGAIYVNFYYLVLFMQGTLGYNAAATGLAGVPGLVFLAFLSSRFGKLAVRYGPRAFMAVGPLVMGAGLLWLTRVPAGSEAWRVRLTSPKSLIPPADYFFDFLPSFLIFGIGLMVMVAPLTTALMTSVPGKNAGVASAVNNAISRVGPQLAGALIFVAITVSFFNELQEQAPNVDTSSASFRRQVSPLNRPKGDVSPELIPAIREASTDSFHLAMGVSAALLFAGAAVNAVGIRNRDAVSEEQPV